MKNIKINFLIPVFNLLWASAIGQWINPMPTGQTIFDIAFFDNDYGLMCGKNGTILRTDDSGTTWQTFTGFNATDFKQIEITSQEQAFLRSDHYLLETDDFGSTFIIRGELDSNYIYKAISMFANNTGYALRYNISSTQSYDLGYTSDGGNTFEWIAMPTEFTEIYNIKFKSQMYGVCTAKENTKNIYYTSDGGNTWILSMSGTDDGMVWMEPIALSSNGIFYVGYSFYYSQGWHGNILKSVDNGMNWSTIYGPAGGDGNMIRHVKTIGDDFIFFAADFMYNSPSAPNLVYTQDGGITWHTSNKPAGYGFNQISALGLKNENQVFVFVDSEDERQLFASQSTGQFEIIGENFSNSIFDVSFIQNKGYLLVNDRSYTQTLLMVSSDGGLNWTLLPAILEGIPFQCSFTSPNTGYVATYGSGGGVNVYKTINGGSTWGMIFTHSTFMPVYLEAFGPDTVILFMASNANPEQNSLWMSIDGGEVWEIRNIPNDTIHDIDFINGFYGLLFGGSASGKIWVTNNGGISWNEISLSLPALINGSMINPLTAIVSLKEGSIDKLYRINIQSGIHELIYSASDERNILNFAFSDINMGYVLAKKDIANTNLLKTINGGLLWDTLGYYNDLDGLEIFYADNGFSFGMYGQLIKLAQGYPLGSTFLFPHNLSFFTVTFDGHHIRVEIREPSYLPAKITIYDLQGRPLSVNHILNTSNLLINNLKPGMYLYRIDYNQGHSTGKLNITH